MVNVLQAMALTDGPRMTLTPTFHSIDRYRPFNGATPPKAKLDTPRWQQGDTELPAVDASVARGADGKLHLALVTLDPARPARVTTNLKTNAQGQVLTAAAMDAHHTFAKPQAQALVLDLPAKSVVVDTVN